jgi:hypothetical protein
MERSFEDKQAYDNFTDGIFSWSRHRRRKRRRHRELQNGSETPNDATSLDVEENTKKSTTEELAKEKRQVTYVIIGSTILIGWVLYNIHKGRPPFSPFYPFSL